MSKSIKKNALAKLALNILNVVLPFITGPYLARTLDKNLYGEFNAAFAIVSWFIPFASF
ncbi:oligosaccharide flippase family protein, partial [Clostridium cadaveris]